MDYNKALEKEHILRGYSKLKKAESIAFLQNNPRATCTRPPRPTRSPPRPPQSVRFRPVRPRQLRQPSSQEIDIFEQQEMSKSRLQVTSKLNDWYD